MGISVAMVTAFNGFPESAQKSQILSGIVTVVEGLSTLDTLRKDDCMLTNSKFDEQVRTQRSR